MNNEWEKVLYHKGKGSELRQWRVWTEGAVIKTEYGVVNGELQQSSKTATPKKVGTKAATTGEQQAILEAKAMYEFKRTRKYSETKELAEEPLLLPMLAKEYRKEKTVLPGYIQRKFDGMRLLSFWDGGSIKLLSRAGKEITVPKHIAEELSKVLPKGSIVDGELYNHGVTFQEVVRRVKKWRPDTTPLVEYHIYDMPSAKGQEDLTFTERLKYLQEFLPQKRGPLVPVETIEIHQHTEIEAFEAKAIAEGYEGAIVRNAAGLYLFGYRNQDLMKVKTFDDAEFKVVDVIDGIGKFEGKACFICQNDLTDDTFECTMATSMEEKAKQFENKDQYIGKMLTVKFFRRTEALLPRFCVGLRFRPEEDLG